MERYTGLIGILIIFMIAVALSDNRKAINLRLVFSGLALQVLLAILILKIPFVTHLFQVASRAMSKIQHFALEGATFVYGGLMVDTQQGYASSFGMPGTFVFAFTVTATIIFICVLVAILYYTGIMQKVISVVARGMNTIMRVSGSEALSNVASAFVGQVEAQILVKPYLREMTRSELLASMSGSMACISGSILVVYANMGARVDYLIGASLMAIPAALVISKIVIPETEISQTKGTVRLEVKTESTNLIDAIANGAMEGMKIAMNVVAILIGFIAFIALLNYGLGKIYPSLSLDVIFGKLFYPLAWCMGVPAEDVQQVAVLMGQKLSINEFIAFDTLTHKLATPLTDKGLIIASFAICGFANFCSVGMQLGGLGTLAPERKSEIAKLGMKALISGTLASYLSATIAGMLI